MQEEKRFGFKVKKPGFESPFSHCLIHGPVPGQLASPSVSFRITQQHQ